MVTTIRDAGSLEPRMSDRYSMLLLCKIKDSYYALDEDERKSLTQGHVRDLRDYSDHINHLVTIGGKFDQVIFVEADDVKTVYDAAERFRTGAKAQHIEVVDTIFGIRVENKSEFAMIGNR